nr:hypothetical protein [Tanacetum cinerariifolium]
MEILIQTCLMPLAIKTQGDSLKFVHELKKEMHADLKYVESLEMAIDELKSKKAEFSDIYDVILHNCVSKDVIAKNSTLSQNPQLRPNTGLWLQLLLRSSGFLRFLRIWSGISKRVILEKGDLTDYWIEISSDRDFLGPTSFYVHIRDLAAAAGSPGATEDAPAADEAVSAPVQAPQPPPLAPQHRTMSQRIDRLEEEVREMRLSIVGLREVVKSSITEQTRVSTWMIRCMMQLMDASGRTYQAFDSTLVSSSWLSYQRLVRSRRDDAGTSIAPHINDQPDP